jgi:uncharacterized protein (DUF58 family)
MRFSARGWWMLVVLGLLLVTGLVGPALARAIRLLFSAHGTPARWDQHQAVPVVVVLALTLLAWYAWEWLSFAVRTRLAQTHIVVERLVLDEQGPVRQLWTGRPFVVRVRVYLKSGLCVHHATLEDRQPVTVRRMAGRAWIQGTLRPNQPLTIEYQIRCTGMGRVVFQGVRVQMSDLHGFFYRSFFVPAAQDLRALPVLSDDLGQPLIRKRINLLPPPGLHRLLRPGSGSELLDLRDYLPGDPPKTIAWKLSAKRERLITKEFESEVPVRCTLFVDTSSSVRLGLPGRNALSRLAEISAAVAQANTSMRDLTGLCLFNENTMKVIRPGRTARNLAEIMNELADAAELPPTRGIADIESLMRLGMSFAVETYPQLIDDSVNRTPWWLARHWPVWRHHAIQRPWSSWIALTIGWFAATLLFLVIGLVEGLSLVLFQTEVVPAINESLSAAGLPRAYVSDAMLNYIYVCSLLFLYFPIVSFVVNGIPTLISSRRRRLARWRKKLSALLAVHYGLGPGEAALLMEDNERFSLLVQRFLGEHHVPYALPFYDSQGRYHFALPEKVQVLADALLRAVRRGRDNELYVLLVDLLELSTKLEPLLAAVRVALARHHQVVVVSAWPPGEAPSPAGQQPSVQQLDRLLADFANSRLENPWQMRTFLERLQSLRVQREFQQVRQAFARLGVPVICAEASGPIDMILDRMERLRGVRSRR